uniref:Uncharacterized protein n=1 Tax=Anguilla anguilla TaxID=7936 RepID=A0A0E9TH81_ANGAN
MHSLFNEECLLINSVFFILIYEDPTFIDTIKPTFFMKY